MPNHELIKHLIENYPDVDLDHLDRKVLIEIAHRYLASERSKLWNTLGERVKFQREDAPLAIERMNRIHLSQKQRTVARSRERAMYDRGKVDTTVSNRIASLVQETLSTVRNEWTHLLDSEFKLPDGTSVTWRNATAKQFEASIANDEKYIATRVETVALKRKAVQDIRKAGVRSLGEIERKEIEA